MPPRRQSPSAPGVSPANSSPSQPPPPSTSASLLHSLRPWPIVIRLAGMRCEFGEFYADTWVAALLEEDPGNGVLELLDEDTRENIVDALIEGNLDGVVLGEAVMNVVTVASGRPWWFTLRLLHTAQSAWDTIGGYMALHGVNAQQISLQAYLDALLAAVLRHVEPKNQTSMLARMKAPPAGATKPAIDEAREADLFMAQMRGQ